MGHNMELYCTQPTVRRGVEKQIKLQQTCGMQIAERGRTRVCQPTRPLNRCKISTGSWRQCSGGEERCSLLERGGGGCAGPLDGVQRNVGSLVPFTFFVSPPVRGQKEKRPQSNSDWGLEWPSGKTSVSRRHFLRTFPHLGDNKPRTTVREETARGETLWCGRSYVFADR